MIKIAHKVIVWRFKTLVIGSLGFAIADSQLTSLIIGTGIGEEGNPLLVWGMEMTGFSIVQIRFLIDAVFYSFLLWAVEHSRFVDVVIMLTVTMIQMLVVVYQAIVLYEYYLSGFSC